MKLLLPLIAVSCLSGTVAVAAEPPKSVLVDVQRIWDKAPHNGFTDLTNSTPASVLAAWVTLQTT